MKRFTLVVTLGTIILLSALASKSVIARIGSQDCPPSELAEIALRPQEFPKEWELSILSEGSAQPDDVSHPLNRSAFGHLEKEVGDLLYNYRGYYWNTIIWNGQSSGLVGNYLYQYASEDQARRVAQALIAAFQQANPAAVYELPKKDAPRWAGRLRGEEGGDVEWFVGTHKNILILLVVDGPSGHFEKGFLLLVEHLLARLE